MHYFGGEGAYIVESSFFGMLHSGVIVENEYPGEFIVIFEKVPTNQWSVAKLFYKKSEKHKTSNYSP
jgi:hypothetical protein